MGACPGAGVADRAYDHDARLRRLKASAGSGAPPFAHPPADHALALRISKLADFAARNGPAFIEEVRSKQHHNPEYAFLFGGEGAPYFAWSLYSRLTAPAAPAAAPLPLPEEVRSGWIQVLDLLNGTRESITASQAWFMACAPHADGMAALTAAAAEAAPDHPRALHLLWLASDILFAARAQRPEGALSDPIAAAWRGHLGRLLHAVYALAGGDPERQQAVVKVVKLWAERGVYPGPEVEAMTMAMMGLPPPPPPMHAGGVSVMPHPPVPHPHAAAPWQPPQPPMHQFQLPPPPPAWPMAPPPPAAPPPPPEPPQEPEFDPFSFPPGLIPRLIDESLNTEAPYAPLRAEDITRSGVPQPPSTDDPYLNAQLDKFYAQLADYRPGSAFADLEMDPPRPRTAPDAWAPPARPVDDGSGGFGPASGRAGGKGLGYGAGGGGEGQGDVFSSYRSMRSQGYHSGILRSSHK